MQLLLPTLAWPKNNQFYKFLNFQKSYFLRHLRKHNKCIYTSFTYERLHHTLKLEYWTISLLGSAYKCALNKESASKDEVNDVRANGEENKVGAKNTTKCKLREGQRVEFCGTTSLLTSLVPLNKH